jgi:hypothetical protein
MESDKDLQNDKGWDLHDYSYLMYIVVLFYPIEINQFLYTHKIQYFYGALLNVKVKLSP